MRASPKAIAQHGEERAVKLAFRCARYYAQIIGPLREVARSFGYALAVHGSIKRDIDVIAVAWIEDAGRPIDLIEALRWKAESVLGWAGVITHTNTHQKPERKPHGRLAWEILLGGGVYIDVSVIPPIDKGK